MKKEVFKYFTIDNKSGWKCNPKKLKNDNMALYENILLYFHNMEIDLPFKEKIYWYIFDLLEKPITYKPFIF